MKTFSFLFIFCLSSVFAQAQWKGQLQAGANYSHFSQALASQIQKSNYRLGFYGGVRLAYEVNTTNQVSVDLRYNRQGMDYELAQGEKSSIRLDYLKLTPQFGHMIFPRFSINAGPEIGYLLQARSLFDGNEFDIRQGFRDWDLGVALGFNWHFAEKISANFRWSEGLLTQQNLVGQVPKNPGDPLARTGKNRSLQLGIGIDI